MSERDNGNMNTINAIRLENVNWDGFRDSEDYVF